MMMLTYTHASTYHTNTQHTTHTHQHSTYSHPQEGWFSIDLSLPLFAVLCSAPWGWFWKVKAAGERVIRGGGRQSCIYIYMFITVGPMQNL
jgi:hypothetical protein